MNKARMEVLGEASGGNGYGELSKAIVYGICICTGDVFVQNVVSF